MAVADTSAERDIKLAGDAMLYGGDIGDPTGPTPRDAKLFLDLTGKAAQRAYELLGASSEMHGGECDDPEVTSRHKGDVTCMHDKQGYACYLGFDLVRGKSIASSVC
jgi:hypothetical protein